MPEMGEIRPAWEIGYKGTHKFIWAACPDCGKERWVELEGGKPRNLRCRACAQKGSLHSRWKGGKFVADKGYILIKLSPDDFFYPMAKSNGYVLEHRLVVAKALGRNLHSWELVHHKHDKYPAGSKEDKADNRYPENLQLVSDDRHTQITILEKKITRLQKENKELKLQLQSYKKRERK